jgi:hypothetical protein
VATLNWPGESASAWWRSAPDAWSSHGWAVIVAERPPGCTPDAADGPAPGIARSAHCLSRGRTGAFVEGRRELALKTPASLSGGYCDAAGSLDTQDCLSSDELSQPRPHCLQSILMHLVRHAGRSGLLDERSAADGRLYELDTCVLLRRPALYCPSLGMILRCDFSLHLYLSNDAPKRQP